MGYNAHHGLLASYETGMLNHADYLESVLQDRDILQGVSTLLSIGVGAGHLECRLAQRLGLSLSYVERSRPMLDAVRRNTGHFGIGEQIGQAFEGSFEEFPTDHTYDLVLSFDSWYHIVA